MNESFKKLQNEFNRIKKKEYIKGIYNSASSIGRTFEYELGLDRNKESMPDYNGIELKVHRPYSKSAITLFTAVPDGADGLEVNRLRDTYGYPSRRDKNCKVLYAEVYGNKANFGGAKYQYRMNVSQEDRKVYLCIYNKFGKLIEKRIYWSFDYLEKKLFAKLKYLAIVCAFSKEIGRWNYFKYYKIEFFALKDFDTFLKLIGDGTIKFMLKIGVYWDTDNYGKIYDHGCSFAIPMDDIRKLFNRYIIDVDKHI